MNKKLLKLQLPRMKETKPSKKETIKKLVDFIRRALKLLKKKKTPKLLIY